MLHQRRIELSRRRLKKLGNLQADPRVPAKIKAKAKVASETIRAGLKLLHKTQASPSA